LEENKNKLPKNFHGGDNDDDDDVDDDDGGHEFLMYALCYSEDEGSNIMDYTVHTIDEDTFDFVSGNEE
jgi:hypothetical protein